MPKRIYILTVASIIAFVLLFGVGEVTPASGASGSSKNSLKLSLTGQAPTAGEKRKEPANQTTQTTCVPTRIMPLGDSITKGSSSGVFDPTLQISYRKDLWDLLVADGYNVDFVGSLTNGENYTGFDANHEGHGGWTDAQIAKNIYGNDGEDWLTQNPADVILLHIGTNALDSSPSDVENILGRVDQFETASGTHVTVVLARIINRIPYSSTTTDFNDNVEAMALDRIAAGDDIVLVDMEDGAGLIYDYYNASPPGNMYDYLHPYATGYTKMAAVWYTALSGILNPCNNQAPIVDPIADQTNAEGDSVSLDVVANDPDGDILSYSATGLPSSLSINSSSGHIQGVIGYEAAASSPYQVNVTVTDDGSPSLEDTVTFTWTVANTNRPPQVTDPGDQSSTAGAAVSLQIQANDPDSDALTYSASGLPDNLMINTSSGLIDGTLAVDAYIGSPYNITITVQDNGVPSLSGAVSFAWTVSLGNRPPVLMNPGAQENAEGDSVSLQVAASDPDGDGLSYSATGLPSGLSINSSNGLIQGNVGYGAAANSPYTVVLSVSDDGSPSLEDTVTFTWTVASTNRPPQVTDPGDQSSAEGDSISLTIQASDPDGDGLSFSATGLPSGLSINSSSGLIQGSVGYSAAANSPYTVVLSVSDDGSPSLEDTVTFTWTVANTNRPPQVTDPGDQSSGEGDPVSLPIQASDPDGETLTYSATGLPAGLEIDPASGLISGAISYAATNSSPYTVMVTVSDDYSPSASSQVTFQWSVTDTNRSPQIVDPVDQTGTVGDAVSLQIQATDPDSDALTYSASGLPANLAIDPSSGLIDGTLAMDAYASSPYDVTITVKDNGFPSLSDVASFAWVVSAGNQPPLLANPGAQESAEGDRVSLQLTASDPDGDTLTYSASGLPDGLAMGAATGLISGTLGYDASTSSPYTVTLSVTDDGLVQFTDVATLTWTVANTNRLPEVANPGSRVSLPGDSVSLQIQASDPDGDVLTYAAAGLPEALSIDPDTGLISGTITTGSVGNNTVEIAISDGQDTLTITFVWGIKYIDLFFPIMRNG
jgi:hypothetical protein